MGTHASGVAACQRHAYLYITARAMVAAPTRLLIKSLLVPRGAIPTNVVQQIIVPDGLNHVRSLSIAALAAINLFV